jgi:hypothetical protein
MAKASKRTNPIILQAGMSIGNNAAEFDDDFLLPCFVHYPPVDLCMKVSSRGMVVDGRTGSGKTAILKYSPQRYTSALPLRNKPGLDQSKNTLCDRVLPLLRGTARELRRSRRGKSVEYDPGLFRPMRSEPGHESRRRLALRSERNVCPILEKIFRRRFPTVAH